MGCHSPFAAACQVRRPPTHHLLARPGQRHLLHDPQRLRLADANPRTFLLTKRSTIISEDGAETVRGRKSTTRCESVYVKRTGERRVQVQRFSTVRAPRRQKKGPQRLRCWQENQRP